jgi:hypothetical protein
MSNTKVLTGEGLAEFITTKIGTPYVYGAKGAHGPLTQPRLMSLARSYPDTFTNIYITKASRYLGQVCTDCSGLLSWYTGVEIGSYQMYSRATKRCLIADIDKAPTGAALWKQGHVGGIINKKGYCVEAKGIDYGTVETEITKTKFTHWLLFEDIMTYDDFPDVITTSKGINPYEMPINSLYVCYQGDTVRWLQWELREAGFDIKIDGDFGPKTLKAVKEFQQSCKIKVDGKVGPITRTCLVKN